MLAFTVSIFSATLMYSNSHSHGCAVGSQAPYVHDLIAHPPCVHASYSHALCAHAPYTFPVLALPMHTLPILTLPMHTLSVLTLPMHTLLILTLRMHTLPMHTLPMLTLPVLTLHLFTLLLFTLPLFTLSLTRTCSLTHSGTNGKQVHGKYELPPQNLMKSQHIPWTMGSRLYYVRSERMYTHISGSRCPIAKAVYNLQSLQDTRTLGQYNYASIPEQALKKVHRKHITG